jgi:hypothetical protein
MNPHLHGQLGAIIEEIELILEQVENIDGPEIDLDVRDRLRDAKEELVETWAPGSFAPWSRGRTSR